MDLNIDLGKVPNIKLVTFIIATFSCILSPYWFLFQFNKHLFQHTDLLNLLLLSLCIGFPLTLFNTLQCYLLHFSSSLREQKDFGYFIVSLGAGLTIGVFYVPLIWTLQNHVTLKEATRSLQYCELGVMGGTAVNMIVALIYSQCKKREKKNLISTSSPDLLHTPEPLLVNTPAAPADPLPHLDTHSQSGT